MEITAALPRIDEHEISVDASAEAAWLAVVGVFEGITARSMWRAYAKAVRCSPGHASGHPDMVGATVPGFRVARCLPPNEWALEGSHLFSHYALTFRISPIDVGHCQVRAESSADFPGLHGRWYRALVIGSGGHVIGVRSILRSIKVRAERDEVGNGIEIP